MPFLFDETLTWSTEFLIDRKLLKGFVNKKIPEVSKIKLQSYGSSINKEFNIVQRIFDIFVFLLRGNSTAAWQKYFRKKYCRKKFINDMMVDTQWFYNIIDIKRDIKSISKKQTSLSIYLWKIKRVLDIIEKGEYNDLV